MSSTDEKTIASIKEALDDVCNVEPEYDIMREKFLCANHKICSEYVESEDTPLCGDCSLLFDKLVFLPNKMCILCNTKGEHVKCPECEHSCCVDCFQVLYWDGYDELEPAFPGSQKEQKEYKQNPQLQKFRLNQNIMQYEADMQQWQTNYKHWFDRMELLRPCFRCNNQLTLAQIIVYNHEIDNA